MDINKKPHWLLGHSSNTYSQTGEDGIIAKILSLLPETDRWCVEFGAWDGIHLSNVRKLILESQYNAVMIEGDASKFQLLKTNYSDNKNVHVVNAFVGFERTSSLDKILSAYEIPKNFDFLSIDIDGNDYYSWEAVDEYRPKVVCIEFNPTIPSEAHFVQSANPRINQGCSVLALEQLARSKGYQLICVLPGMRFSLTKNISRDSGSPITACMRCVRTSLKSHGFLPVMMAAFILPAPSGCRGTASA